MPSDIRVRATAGHNEADYLARIADGHARIEWVRQHSPVMRRRVQEVLCDGSLKGKRIAVVVHLEAKTAYLALLLARAGAQVIAAGSNPQTTHPSVVAALRDKGITVVSDAGGDHASWEKELLAAADLGPEYIIDDGAELTMRIALHRPGLYKRLKGVSEETTTGTARLKALEVAGKLPFPALTANDARCKHLFDNRYGTGQTTIQAIAKMTGRAIAGARLVVVGYGYVGRGIAEYAQAMGARVRVIEQDPVRALEAHMDGMRVGLAKDVLSDADFAVTATGGMRALAEAEFAHLAHDCVLANAGHHDLEVDVDALARLASSETLSAPGVHTFAFEGRDIHVLSRGALVNIAGGSGHPVEIMDLSFAVQGLGAHYLINTPMEAGVHILPKSVDDSIAAAKLASLGITLPDIREEQLDEAAGWVERIAL